LTNSAVTKSGPLLFLATSWVQPSASNLPYSTPIYSHWQENIFQISLIGTDCHAKVLPKQKPDHTNL